MRSSSGTINVATSARKIIVDNRVSLRYYYRIADDILRQAAIFREEKNIIDLYIMLLRFSSLATETIPYHQDFRASLQRDKLSLKKKSVSALTELEELKPTVRQKIDELSRKHAYQSNGWTHLPQKKLLESSRSLPEQSSASQQTSINSTFNKVKIGVKEVEYCHQCLQKENDRLVECNKCQSETYCVTCISKWYPNVSEEEFAESCPVCRNNCNCKACLNGFSPKFKGGVAGIHSCSNGWLSDTESNGMDHETAGIEDSVNKRSDESSGLWLGLAVGLEAKELLESIHHCYPNTFQRIKIRNKGMWLPVFQNFDVVIRRFLETSVDTLSEEELTSLQESLEEVEIIGGFDLSWAHQRLDMVKRLKFGNEPLQQELASIDESLQLVDERVVQLQKEFMEVHEKLKEARLEFNGLTHLRNNKAREMADKFGAGYDLALKTHLGYGILPGY